MGSGFDRVQKSSIRLTSGQKGFLVLRASSIGFLAVALWGSSFLCWWLGLDWGVLQFEGIGQWIGMNVSVNR